MLSRSDYRLTLTIYTVGCKAPISKALLLFCIYYNNNLNKNISICNYNFN